MTINIAKTKNKDKDRKEEPPKKLNAHVANLVNNGGSLRRMSKGSVRDLPEKRHKELRDAFISGTPSRQVIDMIQKDWGELTDVKYTTLEAQLFRFKKVLLKDAHLYTKDGSKMSMKGGKLSKRVAYSKFDGKIDPLVSLGSLVTMQTKRVSKMYLKEENMPALFTTLNKEINTLGNLIGKYAEMGFAMGVIYKAPEEIKTTLVSSDAARALNDSRIIEAKKTNVAGRLLKLVSEAKRA